MTRDRDRRCFHLVWDRVCWIQVWAFLVVAAAMVLVLWWIVVVHRKGEDEAMGVTKIEWADRVWNPVTGCTPFSPGCDNCYARRMANRLRGRCGYPADDPFKVTVHEDRIAEPMRWRKPSRVFVCSMGDLFHGDVHDRTIAKVFGTMQSCPEHTFMVLTKRAQRMRVVCHLLEWVDWFTFLKWDWEREYRHVWLGVSVENQDAADRRIPALLKTPVALRFVSVEPMLGPVDLHYWLSPWMPQRASEIGLPPLNWVICGGETGPGARPMHPDWARSLRDQCQAAGVPFFFKGWGERGRNDLSRTQAHGLPMVRAGKKAAGRDLDGRTWEQFPEVTASHCPC